jgi:hypothetical protein
LYSRASSVWNSVSGIVGSIAASRRRTSGTRVSGEIDARIAMLPYGSENCLNGT